jgi:hypothetical protein
MKTFNKFNTALLRAKIIGKKTRNRRLRRYSDGTAAFDPRVKVFNKGVAREREKERERKEERERVTERKREREREREREDDVFGIAIARAAANNRRRRNVEFMQIFVRPSIREMGQQEMEYQGYR